MTTAPSAPLTDNAFEITTELVEEEPVFNITRPADLTALGTKLPVIAWANGGCTRADFAWSMLFEHWAANGFFVLSLSSSNILGALDGTDKDHHRQLVDWVERQAESGPYAGMLDAERVVLAGNSCGGVTALEAAAEDERPAAIFVLSGSSAIGDTNHEVMSKIRVPLGFVVGNLEQDIAGGPALGDYEALSDGVPGLIVNRTEGDHFTVSTDATILPEVAEIATSFLDLVLYRSTVAHTALTSANACDGCTPGWWNVRSKHLDTLHP